MPRRLPLLAGAAALAAALFSPTARARDPATSRGNAGASVSREEYERLRSEVEALRRELSAVREEGKARAEETDASFEEIDETIAELGRDARAREGGTSSLLLSGNATVSYFDREGDSSTFSVVVRPLFLWRVSERLLFEAKPEIRLRQGTEEASFTLEYANFSFVAHDAAVVGAGKFLMPFGMFNDRFYPGKLLEEPLVYQRRNTGLAPHSEVGAFVRGAFPLDRFEANYAVWVSNGPALRAEDAARPGTLDFGGAFRDTNDDKAVGERLGFLPFPVLEVGASIYYGRVDPAGFESAAALVYGVDAQYVANVEALRGTIDARVEWLWSHVDDATYDPTGAIGFGPLSYDNHRNGGYVEVGYRPSLVASRTLRNVELVGRYDYLDVPDGVGGATDEQRMTGAVLYWVTATTAVSAGYILAEPEEGPDRDTFYLRASVGF